jgi:hypothetical protein
MYICSQKIVAHRTKQDEVGQSITVFALGGKGRQRTVQPSAGQCEIDQGVFRVE